MMDWFTVDKQGLAKLLERRGKAFAITELIQNAWDTNAQRVRVRLEPRAGVAKALIEVEDDDPDGFATLAHAFTLFAESEKKGDATKRGRFNLGEKLVLALCDEAYISSTTGTVAFDRDGRHDLRRKRAFGSIFNGLIRMTRAEYDDAMAVLRTLIPPKDVATTINGEPLAARHPRMTIEVSLPTEVADEEGVLRRAVRKTEVKVYDPLQGEVASVYELGIPVVETGDRWHVDVGQKVPLNFDRDNLPPAYLRTLRTLVANAMEAHLTKDDVNKTWVREASSDPNITDDSMKRILDLRFGNKKVIYDPSDPEANALAVTKGYTVIHGGMLNGAEWNNVKRSGAALPAGQVTPSPKPFSPDGNPLKLLPAEEWTPGIHRVVDFARAFAREQMDVSVHVDIANDIGWGFNAAYGPGHLTINVARLGHRWFDEWPDNGDVERLLIHEFAHHAEPNHLSDGYHQALCAIGAKMVMLALHRPELWGRRATSEVVGSIAER
jgi:hypothetical protein